MQVASNVRYRALPCVTVRYRALRNARYHAGPSVMCIPAHSALRSSACLGVPGGMREDRPAEARPDDLDVYYTHERLVYSTPSLCPLR